MQQLNIVHILVMFKFIRGCFYLSVSSIPIIIPIILYLSVTEKIKRNRRMREKKLEEYAEELKNLSSEELTERRIEQLRKWEEMEEEQHYKARFMFAATGGRVILPGFFR